MDKLQAEKELEESIVIKELKLDIGKPDFTGKMKVSFGAPVALPANVTDWNADNEGGSTFFSIHYKQSDESEEMLEFLNKK